MIEGTEKLDDDQVEEEFSGGPKGQEEGFGELVKSWANSFDSDCNSIIDSSKADFQVVIENLEIVTHAILCSVERLS